MDQKSAVGGKKAKTTEVEETPAVLYLSATGAADDHEALIQLNSLVLKKLRAYPEMEIHGKLQMIHYFDTSQPIQRLQSCIRYVQTLRRRAS